MRILRVRFEIRWVMVEVASVAIALTASRLSRLDLFLAYGTGVLGLIGLSTILIRYLWLRETPGRGPSASVKILIGRFVVLVLGVVSWAMIALWAVPFK
jgi:hypothetical protein